MLFSCPNKNISFVIALSKVKSAPLITPIFFNCELVSYFPWITFPSEHWVIFKIITPLLIARFNSLINHVSVLAFPAPKLSKTIAFISLELRIEDVIFLLIPGNNFNTAILFSILVWTINFFFVFFN